ncbi:MAG: hypothetical protein ACJAY7_001193 [Pseudohongiellaceae bacterium]|jgi:hypothetical protein
MLKPMKISTALGASISGIVGYKNVRASRR